MKRICGCILFTFFLISVCFAQLWEPLAGGTSYSIRNVFADSISKKLYLVGHFKYAGDTMVLGIAEWDGQAFKCLGGGIPDPWYCLPSNYAVCISPSFIYSYNNQVFVSGNFDTIGGVYPIDGLARWDGSQWIDCGNPTSALSSPSRMEDSLVGRLIPSRNKARCKSLDNGTD
ncbi:MAG: hypothetical protein IPN95_10995 [Bacteroidetes bacterium]|nr:hypothetical protein [Bacteroidota bacterium]